MDGWVDGWESRVKDCLQQLKMKLSNIIIKKGKKRERNIKERKKKKDIHLQKFENHKKGSKRFIK
jgi:hypothetical protein